MNDRSDSRDLDLTLPGKGREMVVLRNRYEVASTANDLLIGIWFTVGSVLFFWEATTYAGTWFFVVGSAQLLIRPGIRLARRIHLQRHSQARADEPHDSHDDY